MFTSPRESADAQFVSADDASRALSDLHVLGISYRTADLKTRSAVSFAEGGVQALLENLKARAIPEALILSTCNRTEIYFSGGDFEGVLAALSELTEVQKEKLGAVSYSWSGIEMVRQLFRVASGLDSALLGENEILGQLKSAYAQAQGSGMIGRQLEPLVQRSLRVSKRVRTESEVSRHVTSVAAMAVRKASAMADGLRDKNILLIGAGQIAERIAKELSHTGCEKVFVCNRTADRAERLASLYGLKACDYSSLDASLGQADVVVTAISCEVPLLAKERLEAAHRERGVVVVDLGVPPNVDTSEPLSDAIRLLDMDAIVRECTAGSELRMKAVPQATAIVDEESSAYAEEALEREAAPIIHALVRMAEDVRRQNLDWALLQTAPESAKERKLLEDLSIRLVRGMLQAPIQALKSELRGPVERAVLTRLFAVEVP